MCPKMRNFTLFTFLVLASFSFTYGTNKPNAVQQAKILDELLRGYDKRFRPNLGGEAVDVSLSLYIINVLEVRNHEVTFDMYFRQYWKDPRLSFSNSNLEKMVITDLGTIESIWQPDSFLVNEIKGDLAGGMIADRKLLRIQKGGEVLLSYRPTVRASCAMDFRQYPRDKQLCYLEFESFSFTMEDLRYQWKGGEESGVEVSSSVGLPEFMISLHKAKTIEASLSTGNYSRLAVDFNLERANWYYYMTIYVPLSMVVLCSWMAFFLDRKYSVARVIYVLMILLVMSASIAQVNNRLPFTSYTKSIDVYTGVHVAFVFCALVECVLVDYMMRHREGGILRWKSRPDLIDKVSRVAYPAVYILFFIVHYAV